MVNNDENPPTSTRSSANNSHSPLPSVAKATSNTRTSHTQNDYCGAPRPKSDRSACLLARYIPRSISDPPSYNTGSSPLLRRAPSRPHVTNGVVGWVVVGQ